MSSRDNKILIACVSVTVIFFCGLYAYINFRKNSIENDGIYVIGYVHTIDSDLEGVNYRFFYNYSGKRYDEVIGSLDIPMQKSLIVLKISKSKPNLWLRIDRNLPDCLVDKPDLNKSWTTFPTCDNFDK